MPDREIMVIHNDLPSNDFSTLLRVVESSDGYLNASVPYRNRIYVCVSGSSFHRRILPEQFIHVGFSYNSVHWLSSIPEDVSGFRYGGSCASVDSPALISSIRRQSREDFLNFFGARAEELVPGGLCIYSNGITKEGSPGYDEVFSRLFEKIHQKMLSIGMITAEEYANYQVPSHVPSKDETLATIPPNLKLVYQKEDVLSSPFFEKYKGGPSEVQTISIKLTEWIRSIMESILISWMKSNQRSLQEVNSLLEFIFEEIKTSIRNEPQAFNVKTFTIFLVLVKV